MLCTGMVTESATRSPRGLTIMATSLKVGAISVDTGTEKVTSFVLCEWLSVAPWTTKPFDITYKYIIFHLIWTAGNLYNTYYVTVILKIEITLQMDDGIMTEKTFLCAGRYVDVKVTNRVEGDDLLLSTDLIAISIFVISSYLHWSSVFRHYELNRQINH